MAKVRSDDIATGAVNSRTIADGAIQRRHLAPGAIGAFELGSGVVSGDVIATHGIITNNLSDGVVTAPKVGDDAIIARHIMNGTVEVAKFAESLRPVQLVDSLPALPDALYPLGAVVFHKLEGKLYRNDGAGWTAAVPTGDLLGTITETQIADDAITTPKIAANAVIANHILAGEILADHLAANSVIAGKIQAGAVSTDELAANAISADKIKANAVGAQQLAALYLEVGKYIRSSNYVAGSAGWAIDAAGNAEFNDATFRGDILASTITGSSFKTATTGQRIEIRNSSTDRYRIYFYNSSGQEMWFGMRDTTSNMLELRAPWGMLVADMNGVKADLTARTIFCNQVEIGSNKVLVSSTGGVHSHGTGGTTAQGVWSGNVSGPFDGWTRDTGGHAHELPRHTHTFSI